MIALNKMLFREILKARGQFIAAAAVIFAGITMFAASYMSYLNLKNSLAYYYREYRFLDYYAQAQSISPEVIGRIREIEGVKSSMGRISTDIGADMGNDKRVTLRIISLPDENRPQINDLYMTSGDYLDSGQEDACLLDRKFAQFYNLGKGDRIRAIINQKIYEFKVIGIASSPEFIYAMKSANSVTVSAEDFGIMYVKESTIRSLLDFGSAYNQLHVIFDENIDTSPVTDRIEKMLKPCGFESGTERKDQLSNTMISDEITQLQKMAYMFPALFLSVAAMIIYIMMRRIVGNQRTLIGVMKALGYSGGRIMGHYLAYALMIALAGSITGAAAGIYAGYGMTLMYTEVYNLPVLDIKIYWNTVFLGTALSLGFCLLAGFNSVRRVLELVPAQAMRVEAPKIGKRILIEKVGLIWKPLPFGWKMSVRNIFRSRSRTLFTMLGTVFTIMFFMVSLFFLDCIDYLLQQHFFEFQKQDLTVTFSAPADYFDAKELENIRGVRKAEPILELPVELKNGWLDRGTLLVGIKPDSSFYRFHSPDNRQVSLAPGDVLIAEVLSKKLNVKPGDKLEFKSYFGGGKEKSLAVTGVIKQYIGFNCYMDISELGSLTGEGRYATGALLKIDRGKEDQVTEELFKIPGIETVEARETAFGSFLQYMNLMYVFIGLMIAFGSIMGFAIVFNTTVINITERRRELASLKVLGYSPREIEGTILRENAMQGLIALIPGILFGRFMCEVLAAQFSTELFELEVMLYFKTYAITIVSVFIFSLLAQLANRKNISGLDMVEVLKNREN